MYTTPHGTNDHNAKAMEIIMFPSLLFGNKKQQQPKFTEDKIYQHCEEMHLYYSDNKKEEL